MNILQTHGLTKSYGSILAVQSLDFQINKGTVYGILGPNGSGKTTTLCMILGCIKPDSGSFTWFDGQIQYPNLKVGALLETPNFYPYLNALDNLKITAHIKKSKQDDMDAILKKVGLWEKRQLKFKSFSYGMKQRLAIGATMIGNPDVYIFDEPTNGLDPVGISDMRNVILDLKKQGKTVIMASHMLEEVEKVCDEVLILKNGNKLFERTIIDQAETEKHILIGSNDNNYLALILNNFPPTIKTTKFGNLIELAINNETSMETLSQFLMDNKVLVTHLSEKAPKLEDTFLKITKDH
jgi:ABC-type multidrug transport system ATPase subunit